MLINMPYEEALKHIKEGDVLLFRGRGIISWLIKRYSSGVHSHAGVAHWDGETLECIEFREFKGGRAVSLKSQIESHPDNIDVFRALENIQYDEFVKAGRMGSMGIKYLTFDESVAKSVTRTMLEITGLDYGWKNFWRLARHYLPFYRLAPQNMKDEDPNDVFVCSTAVAYAYRKNYMDPVPYLADSATTPADLARSPLFQYQFTINKDW